MPRLNPNIVTRPPTNEDADAMFEIFMSRKHDTVPGHIEYEYELGVIARHHRFGCGLEGMHADIKNVLTDDYEQWVFARVATIGGLVVGYVRGAVKSDPPRTECNGLMVAEGHDGKGIGQTLASEWRAWARGIGLPARVLVAINNQRSKNFFELQGFTERGISIGTTVMNADYSTIPAPLPIVFRVMELSFDGAEG